MKIQYFSLLTIFFLSQNFYAQNTLLNTLMKVKVKGTGRTTGHVLTLNVFNPSEKPDTLNLDGYFIPSDGKFQGYIIPQSAHDPIILGPGENLSIPLNGFCTDIHKAPVPNGKKPVDISEWIPASTIGESPKPGDQLDNNIFKPIADKDNNNRGNIIITYPDTEIAFDKTIDISKYPKESAPLLFDAIVNIIETYDSLKVIDQIHTPFSGNTVKEAEAVKQQTFWIYTSELTGTPYTKDDFEAKMKLQFTENTGRDIDKTDSTTISQLNSGIDQFWNTFELIGEEAKIININNEDEEVNTEEDIPLNCEYIITDEPGYDFEMKINPEWKDRDTRDSIIRSASIALSNSGAWTRDSTFYAENANPGKYPTSVMAFFKNNVIGAYGSAYARTLLSDEDDTEFIWSTDLSSDIMKSASVTMTVIPAPRWSSFVVGSSYVKLKASSSVFDAVAGNSEHSLEFLRFVKFMGKTALQYLIGRASGNVQQSFSDYAYDQIKDELQSMAEDEIRARIKNFLEDKFGDLLEELGLTIDELEQMSEGDLKSLLENELGIEINTTDDIIDEGLDAIFNMLVWSNTLASVNGGLVVHVGDKSESALVTSTAFYNRTELEDSDQAVSGTGIKIDTFYISDVKPGQITIQTTGIVNLMARGKGNGTADAYIESTQLQVFVGVCYGGPAGAHESVVEVITGSYKHDQDETPNNEELEEKLRSELWNRINSEMNPRSTMGDYKTLVDEFVKEKSLEDPFK